MRESFDRSKYNKSFVKIVDEFHRVMSKHDGRRTEITNREFEVEMSYSFPKPAGIIQKSGDEEKVILHLSHDKNGVFTKHHFTGKADKTFQYKSLKEEIDEIGVKHSPQAKTQYESSISRPPVYVFYEIKRALHDMNCAQIDDHELPYGMKFKGRYSDTDFTFIVYIKKDGRLNTTPKKKTGKLEEPQNPVWESPKQPPAVLKHKIAEIINWVKEAEAGRLTKSEIAGGPTGRIQDLETRMSDLGV
jgi:hypothetical protein